MKTNVRREQRRFFLTGRGGNNFLVTVTTLISLFFRFNTIVNPAQGLYTLASDKKRIVLDRRQREKETLEIGREGRETKK